MNQLYNILTQLSAMLFIVTWLVCQNISEENIRSIKQSFTKQIKSYI